MWGSGGGVKGRVGAGEGSGGEERMRSMAPREALGSRETTAQGMNVSAGASMMSSKNASQCITALRIAVMEKKMKSHAF